MVDWSKYKIRFTKTAKRDLGELCKKLGKRHFKQVWDAIQDLESEPESKTHELAKPLEGLRSLHVSRSRVIVKIANECITVYVIAAGWHESGARSDVYQELHRRVESGAINLDEFVDEEDE